MVACKVWSVAGYSCMPKNCFILGIPQNCEGRQLYAKNLCAA